jgi:hypothetical protein
MHFFSEGLSLLHAMCAERDEIGQSPVLFWQRWETRFLDASWPSIREARAHNTPYVNPSIHQAPVRRSNPPFYPTKESFFYLKQRPIAPYEEHLGRDTPKPPSGQSLLPAALRPRAFSPVSAYENWACLLHQNSLSYATEACRRCTSTRPRNSRGGNWRNITHEKGRT